MFRIFVLLLALIAGLAAPLSAQKAGRLLGV